MWTRRPFLRSFFGLLGASATGAISRDSIIARNTDGEAPEPNPPGWFRYPEPGSRARPWAAIASKHVELSGFTGADPAGNKDSYSALRRAMEVAARRHGELVIDGGFRIGLSGREPLRVTTPLTLRGAQPGMGNIAALSDHGAALYFEHDAPTAIVVANSQLTVSGCALIGPARLSSGSCIRTEGLNSALRLCNGAIIQSWHTGIVFESGFYHRINDASVLDCMVGIAVAPPRDASGIYNLVASQLKISAAKASGSSAMIIRGGSQVSLSQSSFESFTANGIVVEDSSVDLLSSYFEGSGGTNILLGRRASVNAVGNRVYLSEGAQRWIGIADRAAVEVRVVALGNQFVAPKDDRKTDIYTLHGDDPLAVSNIGEDVILNRATMGGGVHYVAESFLAGSGPAALRGSHSIRFPAGDARQYAAVATLPVAIAPARSTPAAAPAVPTLLSFGPNTDPDQSRQRAWGAEPIMMVFHRSAAVPDGQWEKIGLQLPPIAPPAGGGVVDREARRAIVTLLDALIAQGVMPRR